MRFTLIFVLLGSLQPSFGHSRFRNISCKVLNRSIIDIVQCSMKSLNNGSVVVNVHVKVVQPPASKLHFTYSIWRDENGFKPFFNNITFDFCRFMKNQNHFNYYYWFQKAIEPYTNMNHTCPYKGDVIVKDFVLLEDMLRLMPLPKGSYMHYLLIAANYVKSIETRVYLDQDLRNYKKRTSG